MLVIHFSFNYIWPMSSRETKLNVAFLWHQHQPFYRVTTPEGPFYLMPWVRFHAVKDYYDIPFLLKAFPSVRQNFNLVPSMLAQIEDYVANRASDNVLRLTRPAPGHLEPDDKKAILRQFFVANLDHMIKPYPRYAELWEKRKSPDWSNQDWLDLQVWYNLCWIGQSWKKQEPFAGLFEKGRFFTEEDKTVLIEGHYAIMAQVIPLYRELFLSGQIELSVTPYYHPILPLLCDSDIHRISNPARPPVDFHFKHPEDADAQIKKAVTYFTRLFSKPPQGMWPSEGSVSAEAADLMRRNGLEWIATDEEILQHSETADGSHFLYQPWAWSTPSGPLAMVFRDHQLSDAIGFTYAKWKAGDAVRDFLARIEAIRQTLIQQRRNPSECLLNVILDGENCWEFYERNGEDFLMSLFAQLSDSATLRSCTISDFLKEHTGVLPARPRITRLHPGSWIGHNFDIWIGKHAEKNLAWKYLTEARALLESDDPGRRNTEAWETLYIAEGSDWFWWFGDDHQAENKQDFDELFRHHLRHIYGLLGVDVPGRLAQPIMQLEAADLFTRPSANLTPRIDGIVSNYYEWQDAGVYEAAADSDAMHISEVWIQSILYGFDDTTLFIRVDFEPDRMETIRKDPGLSVRLEFYHADALRFSFDRPLAHGDDGAIRVAFEDILEIAVPLPLLNIRPSDAIEMAVAIVRNEREIVRRPSRHRIVIDRPDRFFDKYLWSV